MARSKGILYSHLIFNHTKILKDTTRYRMLPSTAITGTQAWRSFCDLNHDQELPPPPPPPPSSSPWSSNWNKWTAGLAVTTVISLLQFKKDVDLVMGTTEEIIDLVEVVAEAVDMVAEKVVDDLPDGSKLKATVELVEEVAETVAGKAQEAVHFIDEVQEGEQKLSPFIEPVKELTQGPRSAAS